MRVSGGVWTARDTAASRAVYWWPNCYSQSGMVRMAAVRRLAKRIPSASICVLITVRPPRVGRRCHAPPDADIHQQRSSVSVEQDVA